jgi:hypothetical protein
MHVTPGCRGLTNSGELVVQQLDPDANELDELGIGLLVVFKGLGLVHVDPRHGSEIANDLTHLLGQLLDVGYRI